jgi:hypothetical protein
MCLGLILTIAIAAHPAAQPAQASPLQSRIVIARIDAVSFERADFRLQAAVRTPSDLTVRRLSFSDSAVEGVPVWIPPIAGVWKLKAGEEFMIPGELLVQLYARDLARAERVADVIQRGSLRLTTTVEIEFATPWPGRLLLMGPSQTAIAGVELTLPFAAGPAALQPLLRLGASVAESVRDRLAPIAAWAGNQLPERRGLLDRFASAIEAVTTDYTIEDETGVRTARTDRALGFWWTPRTFCTTREALEPWRFDFAEAAVLQVGSGRLAPGSVTVTVGSGEMRPARRLDGIALGRRLRTLKERKLYTPVDDVPRTIKVLDRESDANLACLHLDAASAPAPLNGLRGAPPPALAAFAAERPALGLMWTETVGRVDNGFRLRVPLTHHAYGSPLVSSAGVAGILVAHTRALDVAAIERAAGRAVEARDLAAAPR